MSRLERLKELRIKNRMKATVCGLALALAIGSAQGLGTYALFTDTEDVASNLTISTGDVDVEASPGNSFIDIKPNNVIKMPITITNNGTLNQNISLELSASKDIKSHLTHKFVFDNGITVNDDGVMYKGEELFVLAQGESITGSTNITVGSMERDEQNNLCGTEKGVDITVKARQTNKDNTLFEKGFYDEAIQKNTITIAQKEVISIATGEKAYFTNGNGNSFKKLYIPINVKSTTSNVTLTAKVVSTGNGNVNKPVENTYTATYGTYNPYGDYILIQSTNNKDELPFKGVVNITITVTVDDGQNVERYDLECNVTLANAGNSCTGNHPDHDGSGNGGKCHGEIVYSGHKVVLNTPEEVKESIELDVIQLPNEVVEESTKLEVIEPPKEEVKEQIEPEVMELPKEEITEIPKQPEVIELLKENEGI